MSTNHNLRRNSGSDQKVVVTDSNFFSIRKGVYFFQLFYLSTPKASNCDPTVGNYLLRLKNNFLENGEIFITQPILVSFWSLWYLWKRLCKRILDLRLSHTFTHSFSHLQTVLKHFSHHLSYFAKYGPIK